MQRTRAIVLVAVASVIWATTGTAAALIPDVPPAAVGAATLGIGGLLLLCAFPRRAWRMIAHRDTRRWVLIGGLAVFAYAFAFYAGMRMAGVAVGTVLNIGSAPVFAALLEWAVERHRPTRQWCAGAALAIAGLVAMTAGVAGGAAAETSSATRGLGVLLSLAAGALYALYAYASSRALARRDDPPGAIAAIFGVGGILLLPVVLTLGALLIAEPRTILIATYLAVFAVFLAYLMFGVALRHITTSTATTITLLEPVLASILAAVVLAEPITALGWAGVGIVVCGVLVASVPVRRARLSAGRDGLSSGEAGGFVGGVDRAHHLHRRVEP